MTKFLTSRWLRWTRDIIVVLAAVWAVNAWHTRDMLSGSEAEPGFAVVSLSSEVVTIQPDASRPTLLYFFAPWCGVCRASIGNLDYIDSDKVQVAVIALDYANQTEVEQFVAEVGLKAPVYLGSNQVKERFKVRAYPSYYVLDESFNVTGRTVGYSTAAGLLLRTL